MLKASEILLETIKKDGRPERLLRQYEGATFYPPNPANNYVRGNRHRGMEPMKDLFGTEILWPQEQLAAMPHVTEDNKVIDDITEWKEQLVIPDIVGQCSDPALWEPFKQKAQEIKDSGSLFMAFMPTGVFERLHFLMGFEDMLVNFLLEPEDMMDLCNAIGEYRFQLTKLIVDNLHPDIILSHDDWGSKQSLFISPDTWREFIKPQYERSYKYMKDHGVIIMHHADSFMEPIIEDMVDLGIDIWQGTLPQNDIPKLQKQLNGRMTLMGGIDASIVDRVDSTEEEIRKLESKKRITANETVSGSNPEFPYNPQHFKVQGTTYSYSDDVRLRAKKEVLKQKKEKAEELKLQVEVWMISIPFRMQRIIKYKIFEDMTWQQVADRMGRKVTEESVRKEFKRFFEKN